MSLYYKPQAELKLNVVIVGHALLVLNFNHNYIPSDRSLGSNRRRQIPLKF